jgi:hypothetical protein
VEERFTNPDRFSKTQTGFQKTRHVEHEMLKTQTGSQKTRQALKKPDTLPRHIITNPDTVLLIQTRAPKTGQSPPQAQTHALNQTHHQAQIQTARHLSSALMHGEPQLSSCVAVCWSQYSESDCAVCSHTRCSLTDANSRQLRRQCFWSTCLD